MEVATTTKVSTDEDRHTDPRDDYMKVGTDVYGDDHIFRTFDNTLFVVDSTDGVVVERFTIPANGIDEYVGRVRDEGKWDSRQWLADDENAVQQVLGVLNGSDEYPEPLQR